MKHLLRVILAATFTIFTINATALCIGCGCEKDYKRCKDCEVLTCCDWVTGGEVNMDCCDDLRADCHTCSDGIVCIKFGMVGGEAVISAGDEMINYDDLSDHPEIEEDLLPQLQPIMDLIQKVLDGGELSDDEYARIP